MSPRGGTPRHPEAGFTLVEVLVALALFAMIGAAGFTMLDQILLVQARTEGRLERLAQIQRVVHLVSTDFMQAESGSLDAAEGAVSLRRSGAESAVAVRYRWEDPALIRSVSGALGQPATEQSLLHGVSALGWRFLDSETGWSESWPPANRPSGNPAAVEIAVTLEGPGLAGALRRVAILPADPSR